MNIRKKYSSTKTPVFSTPTSTPSPWNIRTASSPRTESSDRHSARPSVGNFWRPFSEDVHAALSGEWNDLIRSGKNAPGADVRSGDDDFVRCAKILQEKRLREARSKWQQARDTLTGDIRFLSVRVCYISGTHNDILSCHYYIKEDEFGSRQTCYERGINYAPDGRHLFEADLFKEGWEESLTELLSESFSSGFKTRDLTPFGPVRPNGNFKFNSGGIIWMYDAGEIAPAKDGILRVSLPWSSLQPLMRE